MTPRRLLMVSGVFVLLAVAWTPGPAPTTDVSTDAIGEGYRVYIDPATGTLTSTPNGTDPITLDKDMQNALSNSAEGLRVEPSPVEGGGMMIQLDGRFRSVSTAAVDEDGEAVVPCVTGLTKVAGKERGAR